MIKLEKEKWEWVKLGEVSKIQYGSSAKSDENPIGYKTFRMNELVDGNAIDNGAMKYTNTSEKEFLKYRLIHGDLLFNRTNSYEHVGRTGIFLFKEGDYMFASYLIRISVNRDIVVPYYLNALMNADIFQKRVKVYATKAVGQANINATSLSNIELPFPPMSEQKQLAALFQSIETAIEAVDKEAKRLKALRKQLINGLTRQQPQFGNIINKSSSKECSIGELAIETLDRTDNPSNSGLNKFIGLEDFESGELFIQKYSSTEKLVSAMKLCKKGNILFARRNAYLKRASFVDFDAVCSGDVIVMQADENIILSKFLILLMNTNEFWEFAISNAAGTISKRVKWRDLATYTFQLPDLETQAKIVGVFIDLQTTLNHL